MVEAVDGHLNIIEQFRDALNLVHDDDGAAWQSGYLFFEKRRSGTVRHLQFGIKEIEKGNLAVLSQGERFEVTADEKPVRLILVAGRPLREPIAKYGPFVMNTAEEIHQAVADFQAGRL